MAQEKTISDNQIKNEKRNCLYKNETLRKTS